MASAGPYASLHLIKVPHKRLLEKLNKHGIREKLLSVIGNWLSNRKQGYVFRVDGQNRLQYGVGFRRGLF